MKLITVGDNCMDVYQQIGKAFPGGNPVNVAVYLRRLGHDVNYIGVVGNDNYGNIMLNALKEKGIGVSHVHQIPGETARSMVDIVEGDRVFGDYFEGVMKDFSLSEDDLSFIAQHDLLHTAYWGETDPYLKQIKEGGTQICYDFADKPEAPKVKALIPFVDYALFSFQQDDTATRSFMKRTQALGPKQVIVTLGKQGSLVFDGKEFTACGVEQVDVVDTMGAGDSFIAGYLAGIAEGKPILECMKMGTKNAAVTLGYSGAW